MLGKKFLATKARAITGSPLTSLFQGNVSTANSTLLKKNITPLTNRAAGTPVTKPPQKNVLPSEKRFIQEQAAEKKEHSATSDDDSLPEEKKPS